MIVSTLTAESPPSLPLDAALSGGQLRCACVVAVGDAGDALLRDSQKEAQVQVKLKVPPSALVPKRWLPKTLVVEEKVDHQPRLVALKPAPVPAAARSLALAPQMLASKLAGKETAAPKKVEMASPPRPVEKRHPNRSPTQTEREVCISSGERVQTCGHKADLQHQRGSKGKPKGCLLPRGRQAVHSLKKSKCFRQAKSISTKWQSDLLRRTSNDIKNGKTRAI